jgi:hypothetical protein
VNIREDSQYGLQWFRPTWRQGELSKVKESLRGRVFQTVDSAAPAYLDAIVDTAHVVQIKGQKEPSIRLVRGHSYNVDSLVLTAKRSKNPKDSPEGSYTALKPGDNFGALKFIDAFGPLFWPQKMLAVSDWIHLDDFWSRHARFVAISKLWRSLRDGDQAIQEAWDWIADNYAATKITDEPDLGKLPRQKFGNAYGVPVAIPLPWEVNPYVLKLLPAMAKAEGRLHDEIVNLNPKALNRTLAIALVQHELTRQTEGAKTLWRIEDDGKNLRCVPERRIESLWAAIWEIFAADAGSGLSWRYCKACGKPFYPKRIDSDCCTTAEQSEYSKTRYAAEIARLRKGK